MEYPNSERAMRPLLAGIFLGVAAAVAVGSAWAQEGGLEDAFSPRGSEGAPELDTGFPPVEELVVERMDVPAKAERLPDETTVKVSGFEVTRLAPKGGAGGCEPVPYDGFCGQRVSDPELDAKLQEAVEEFGGLFSIFDLEDVAVRVTTYYRAKEYILDTAFLPPQTVQDGLVKIYVLEGRLGKVTAKGNERYDADVLQEPFAGLEGHPITRDGVTNSLLTVWDYPGLRFAERKAQITFFPGESTGESDLELEVFEDKYPVNLILSGDNAGSEYSGEYRTRADLIWNNPTGAADMLAVAFTYTFDPKNNPYYSLDYRRPIITPDYHIGIGASRNTYDIGAALESLGIDGTTEQAYISLDRVFFQSFREKLAASLRFSREDAETNQNGVQLSKDKLAPLEIGVDYLVTDSFLGPEGAASQTRMIGNYTHGFGDLLGSMDAHDAPESSRVDGDGDHAGAEYDKLVGGFIRKQAFFKGTTLWLRANGQYSSDVLVPLEQFAIGGPNSVRAYPTAVGLFDKGYFLSAEWSFGLPIKSEKALPEWMAGPTKTTWPDALSLSVFIDSAQGWLNKPREDEIANGLSQALLSGAGVGLRFQTRHLWANMSLAWPLSDRQVSNDPQFFFNVGYQPF
jgi:hemolysin activation/secretion protein